MSRMYRVFCARTRETEAAAVAMSYAYRLEKSISHAVHAGRGTSLRWSCGLDHYAPGGSARPLLAFGKKLAEPGGDEVRYSGEAGSPHGNRKATSRNERTVLKRASVRYEVGPVKL